MIPADHSRSNALRPPPAGAADDVDDAVRPKGQRIVLKREPRLRRVGQIHALMVMAFTPIAAVAVYSYVGAFGVGVAELAIWAVAHLVGFSGVALAMHRYFAHRSFDASPAMRAALAVLAMSAAQGSVLFWVSDHRRHHRFADRADDPHSPSRPNRGVIANFWHAHMGWMFDHDYANPAIFAPDILADRRLMWFNRHYLLWVALGLTVPALIGAGAGAIFSNAGFGALQGFVWAGLLRVCGVQHLTFCVNSFGHLVGARRFDTTDRSRNLALLALPTLGDSWHNNHHAYPGSARMGLRWWEFDLGYLVLRVLSIAGLIKNLKSAPLAKQQ